MCIINLLFWININWYCKIKILFVINFFLVDIIVYYRGCYGDLNEIFFVGNVDERSKKLVKIIYECLFLVIDEGMKVFIYFFFVLRFLVIYYRLV